MQIRHTMAAAAVAALAAALAGCATGPTPAELDAQARAMMMSSFRDQGIAKVERLNRDLGQAACSSDKEPPQAVARQIEAQALASIRWPAGGQYFGDFVAGERLAQSGVGMAWNNPSTDPTANGGNCYNCHRISKEEISYGTIGPSLYNYGRIRGVSSLSDPAAAPIIQYTWGKLWNSKAYTACSNMPRFGHQAILDEAQIRNLMSLLLDPRSPVNQ